MHTLKFALEKPSLIWFLISAVYVSVFWTSQREQPLAPIEETRVGIVEKYAAEPFPPPIGLLRETPDWGHLGYYALAGRAYGALNSDSEKLRGVGLATMLAGFFAFIQLGLHFTYRNRLSPIWVSLALIVFAANPYAWWSAFRIDYLGLWCLLMFVAMLLFEKDQLGWAALFTSAAVLVDFRALLLAVAVLLTRVTGESSRLIRPERMLAFIFPFIVAALPLIAWQGVVPQGEAREWLAQFLERAPKVRPDGLFYSLALLPLYAVGFSWSWGIRARTRALTTGAIVAAICIPLYFIFPIHFDWWEEIKNGAQVPLGIVDQGALLVAGPYKNLVLFVPWLAGAFLFIQLVLMDVLDRSRWLRYFVIFYFLLQPFVIGSGDREFLIVLPSILLLSLSEALVGEEGKLA